MIRSVCMICNIQYGTKEPDEPGDMTSHGLCRKHYDEAMANIESQFAEMAKEREAA